MNNLTPCSALHQRRRFTHYAGACNSYSYFNLLTGDALFDEVESLLPDHRERHYPPTETLSMFLVQAMSADRSCQNIVNQAAVDRALGGLPSALRAAHNYCSTTGRKASWKN